MDNDVVVFPVVEILWWMPLRPTEMDALFLPRLSFTPLHRLILFLNVNPMVLFPPLLFQDPSLRSGKSQEGARLLALGGSRNVGGT